MKSKPLKLNRPKVAVTKKETLPKYTGKGTRARLNTAAEKHMFNSRYN